MIRKELTIVILSYNTKEVLSNCLNSLVKSGAKDKYEVIVVDNASTDGSEKYISEKFSWVKLIKNKKNLGFSAGNNIALKKISSEYVLLLNPDTVVLPNTIDVVLDFLKKNKDAAAATCRVELPSGKLDYSCHRGFPTPWNSFCYFSKLASIFPNIKLFSGYTMSYKNMNEIHEIDSLTGAFALIRTKAGSGVNWLDEDYFWNGEDLDFCFKLKEKGWKIYFIPEVKITHYKGSASGLKKTGVGKTDKIIRRRSALSSTQVMRIFYEKHLAKKYPSCINGIVYLGINLVQKFRLAKSNS